jgi:hypothetical protein
MSQQQAPTLSAGFPLEPDVRRLYDTLHACLASAEQSEEPYRHWIWRNVLPEDIIRELSVLPFPKPDLHGVSGKRELHNDSRHYFDAENNKRFPACDKVSRLFQADETVRMLQDFTGADLSNTNVRLEYTLDADCFWLQPHTDLGVKRITLLLYMPDAPDQEDLGTDVYKDPDTWACRPPFEWNAALGFVPSDNTYHGFEKRDIPRVRRTMILNYVTQDWRAREQLAYPDMPVRA